MCLILQEKSKIVISPGPNPTRKDKLFNLIPKKKKEKKKKKRRQTRRETEIERPRDNQASTTGH